MPASASWLIISPSDAFLPPTESTSVIRNRSSAMTDAVCPMKRLFAGYRRWRCNATIDCVTAKNCDFTCDGASGTCDSFNRRLPGGRGIAMEGTPIQPTEPMLRSRQTYDCECVYNQRHGSTASRSRSDGPSQPGSSDVGISDFAHCTCLARRERRKWRLDRIQRCNRSRLASHERRAVADPRNDRCKFSGCAFHTFRRDCRDLPGAHRQTQLPSPFAIDRAGFWRQRTQLRAQTSRPSSAARVRRSTCYHCRRQLSQRPCHGIDDLLWIRRHIHRGERPSPTRQECRDRRRNSNGRAGLFQPRIPGRPLLERCPRWNIRGHCVVRGCAGHSACRPTIRFAMAGRLERINPLNTSVTVIVNASSGTHAVSYTHLTLPTIYSV